MNERIIKIGLESGVLNYIDNETPRHYFLSGHADEQDLAKFAQLIVRECVSIAESADDNTWKRDDKGTEIAKNILQHFGVE